MINLDLNEEAKYLMEKSGCTHEQAKGFVISEDKFFKTDGKRGNLEENKDTTPVISHGELVSFIAEDTGMDKELVERLSEYELKYFERIGLL